MTLLILGSTLRIRKKTCLQLACSTIDRGTNFRWGGLFISATYVPGGTVYSIVAAIHGPGGHIMAGDHLRRDKYTVELFSLCI